MTLRILHTVVAWACIASIAVIPRSATAQTPVAAPIDEVSALYLQAEAASERGDWSTAEVLVAQALAKAESGLPKGHLAFVPLLRLSARSARKLGKLPAAKAFGLRLVDVTATAGKPLLHAVATYELAETLYTLDDLEGAWKFAREALRLCDALPGADIQTAQVLVLLGQVTIRRGTDLEEAVTYLARLVAWLQGPTAPPQAAPLLPMARSGYAKALALVGRLAQAEDEVEQVLRLLGPAPTVPSQRIIVAELLNTKAQIRAARGDSAQALQAVRAALQLLQGLPQAQMQLADCQVTEAKVLLSRGMVNEAIGAASQAVAVMERERAASRPFGHMALAVLARCYERAGRAADAMAAQSKVVEILQGKNGSRHVLTLAARCALAGLLLAADRAAESERMVREALGQAATITGDIRIFTADLHSALAAALDRLGRSEESLRETELALADRAGRMTSFMDDTADLLRKSRLLVLLGKPAAAVSPAERALRQQEEELTAGLAAGSESDRRRLILDLENSTAWAVHLAVQFGEQAPAAAELAAQTVLRRRGRLLEAMAGTLRGLRYSLSAADAALLDDLAATRRRLAALVAAKEPLAQPSWYAQVQEVKARLAELEAKAAESAGAIPSERRTVTVAGVQAALPPGAALVEYWSYRPALAVAGQLRPAGPPSLAAVVLRRGKPPVWRAIGAEQELSEAVGAWADKLRNPRVSDVDAAGAKVAQLAWAPLSPALQGADQFFVVPDGALAKVPFGALPVGQTANGSARYLVETGAVVWLGSGRDLLAPSVRTPRQPPLLFADPEFGPGALGQLPGARQEGKAIAELLGAGAMLHVGLAASRAALEAARGPAAVHLATHGWFSLGQTFDNPLLGSGIALAGANAGPGKLTALDVANLDLHGTQLVTLSACETGLGVQYRGDGVYGLQRALHLAGAQSVVMSLWTVDDEATRQLMVAFYGALAKGTPRATALRQAQLALLNQRRGGTKAATAVGQRSAEVVGAEPASEVAAINPAHPYWWAAFVLTGEGGKVVGLVGK